MDMTRFTPRGPTSSREQVMVAFDRWLVGRYRAAEKRREANVYA